MINLKLIRNGGIALSIVFGLSSCQTFDGFGMHRDEMHHHMAKQVHGEHNKNEMNAQQIKKESARKGGSATEPAQKTAPGPKRKAAPQIPVIQQ